MEDANKPNLTTRRSFRSQIDAHARVQWMISGALVLLLAGLYVLAYRPIAARGAALDREMAAYHAEFDAAAGRSRNAKEVEAEIERLRVRMERFDKLLPSLRNYWQEYGMFTRDITQLAQQSAIKKINWVPSPVKRTGVLTEQPVSLSFEGDFMSVFAFLRQAEVMQRLTRVRKLSLKSIDSKIGVVEVQLSMNLYFSDNP